MPAVKEYINPAGLRLDGRRPNESRRLMLEFGKVAGCDGCCTVKTGRSHVCATVYGPREVSNRLDGKYNQVIITCDVVVVAFAGERRRGQQQNSRLSEEVAASVLDVARSVVLLSQYPNSQIHICVEILKQDGSDKVACINAACLALIDASVAMKDVVHALTVGLIDGSDVVDLTTEEMHSQCPTICVALQGHDPSNIVWMESNSRLAPEVITRLVKVAQGASRDVFETALRRPLEEHAAMVPRLQANLGCGPFFVFGPSSSIYYHFQKEVLKKMQDDMQSDIEPRAKRIRHETAPAMTFPYELDKFQKDSINALENGDSVLVSAHTSAGKTTVALYAIAKAVREKKRVIYTSPIKALSNQKFREFTDKFDSVGLMTGDTTIKVDSDCLVMTTEILRSMLYRGTEMLREVGCVVFDEVHYMRDKSRGVVWEETISLLPEGCQYVFLSATIPNAREFADWVESIHPGTKVHVIHTDYRPVPLHHYVYPCGADGIFLIIDEFGKFREDSFRRAMSSIGAGNKGGEVGGAESTGGAAPARTKQRSMKRSTEPIKEIINLAMNRNMYPIIVFAFSKAECERNALALSKQNFNNTEEDALVTEVFKNAMECLATEDKNLPAIEHLLPLLKRGVGIHHSGLLPILKEVVEILFQAGLVKVLFSTETFSMGLNMPARTVLFTSVKKFDGETNRYLTGGEYIQMSGRAGRRGLDRVGIVIAMVDESVEPEILKQVTRGGADVLNSSFHLTYNMVLNLLRVEDADPEFMMRRSFAQFQRLRNRPTLEKKAEELTAEIGSIRVEHEEMFREYDHCRMLLEKKREQIGSFLRNPLYIRRFISVGRILRIRRSTDGVLFGWGVCRSVRAKTPGADKNDPSAFCLDALVVCRKVNPSQPTQILPCHITEYSAGTADLYTVTFDFTDIDAVSRFRLDLSAEVDTASRRAEMIQKLESFCKHYGDDVPLLTSEELGIEDPEFKKLCGQLANIEKLVNKCELVHNPTESLEIDYESFKRRANLEKELEAVKQELDHVGQAIFTDELKKMMRVLRRLDYIDKDNIILRKARVACEITTSDENELLLTELLFKGVLNSMETEMIVALMSCLVNVHRTPDGFQLPEEFRQPLDDLNEIVNRIATLSIESGITQENTNVEKTMPSLMEVTYLWAKGAKFSDIVTKTNAYEGDIVRMMRRLEEQLRQMAGAARSPAIGCMELHTKFLRGIQLIKRDIVFASSLYL